MQVCFKASLEEHRAMCAPASDGRGAVGQVLSAMITGFMLVRKADGKWFLNRAQGGRRATRRLSELNGNIQR